MLVVDLMLVLGTPLADMAMAMTLMPWVVDDDHRAVDPVSWMIASRLRKRACRNEQ